MSAVVSDQRSRAPRLVAGLTSVLGEGGEVAALARCGVRRWAHPHPAVGHADVGGLPASSAARCPWCPLCRGRHVARLPAEVEPPPRRRRADVVLCAAGARRTRAALDDRSRPNARSAPRRPGALVEVAAFVRQRSATHCRAVSPAGSMATVSVDALAIGRAHGLPLAPVLDRLADDALALPPTPSRLMPPGGCRCKLSFPLVMCTLPLRSCCSPSLPGRARRPLDAARPRSRRARRPTIAAGNPPRPLNRCLTDCDRRPTHLPTLVEAAPPQPRALGRRPPSAAFVLLAAALVALLVVGWATAGGGAERSGASSTG